MRLSWCLLITVIALTASTVYGRVSDGEDTLGKSKNGWKIVRVSKDKRSAPAFVVHGKVLESSKDGGSGRGSGSNETSCIHTNHPNYDCVPFESCNATSRVQSFRCDGVDLVCCLEGNATRAERAFVNSAVTSGLEELQKRDQLEKELVTKDLMVKPYTSEGMYNEYMNSDDKALDAERNSFVMVQAVKYLSYKVPKPNDVNDAVQRFMDGDEGSLDDLFQSFDLPIGDQIPSEMQTDLGMHGTNRGPSLGNLTSEGNSGDYADVNRGNQTRRSRSNVHGEPQYECSATKYRSIDGSCNNLKNPDWGRAFRVYNRLLSAKYSDGVASPRNAYDGSLLPSARQVSTSICTDEDHLVHDNSLMSMQWGQFIDHEMGFTPIYKARGTNGILCCAKEIDENPHLLHPECYPIEIPDDDPFHKNNHGSYQKKCMEFVRSLAGPTAYGDKYGGKRQQLNQVSSFVDGSVIYGSSHKESGILRSFENGQLKSMTRHGKAFVPVEVNPSCTDPSLCYRVISGDSRANQHPWLTVLHNLFHRAHNYIANEFHLINPHWNDEQLYQETRRIIIAKLQHITYNEFLPSFFGYEFLKQYGLDLKRYGFSNDYDANINPTTLNEFTAAAFRVGHSLIHGTIEYRSKEYGNGQLGQLRDHYFSPQEILEKSIMDKYILSLMTQWPQRADVSVTKEVTNYLFKAKNESHGLDLISLNIQRGRDHGLQPYNEYRKLCGMNKAQTFDDLYPSMDKNVIEKLKYLYKTVDDIDIFIGGIAEKHNRYSLLGPTFACIIANQFRRVKRGDRFWYEIGYQPNSFTPDQLQEIRKTSLGSIICQFSDDIEYVQRLVFKQPNAENPVVSCQDDTVHYRLDLTQWKQGPESVQRVYRSPPEYRIPEYGSPEYGGNSYRDQDNVYITKGSYQGPASEVDGSYGGGPGYGPGGPGHPTVVAVPASAYNRYDEPAFYDSNYGGPRYRVPDGNYPPRYLGGGDQYKSGPYVRSPRYSNYGGRGYGGGGYGGVDKSLYANDRKSSYDSAYRASDDHDRSKSAYYDSASKSYDKSSDAYSANQDSYANKDSARKHSDSSYYDKDSRYGDHRYSANRRYYASNYGANRGYEDSVYSSDRYNKAHAASDHKEYDSAADKKSSAQDSSAYSAKSYTDSASKHKDSSYDSKDHDDSYKAASKASYDSDDSYSAKTEYVKPVYTSPNYDSGYSRGYDSGYSKGPSYDSGYSGGSNYGTSGYQGGSSYGGPSYDSGYQSGSSYGGPSYDSGYNLRGHGGSGYNSRGHGSSGYNTGYSSGGHGGYGDYGGSSHDSGYSGGYDSNHGSYGDGYSGNYDPSYGGSSVVHESGYSGGSSYGSPAYETGYARGTHQGKPSYETSYSYSDDKGYRGHSPTHVSGYSGKSDYNGHSNSGSGYKSSDYTSRYQRSHNDTDTDETVVNKEGTNDDDLKLEDLTGSDSIIKDGDLNVTTTTGDVTTEVTDSVKDVEDESDKREERSYSSPSHDRLSAYNSKSSDDYYNRASSDHDRDRSSYYDSDVRSYDKEADNYGRHSDSYYDSAYGKKYSEADYYDKDAVYRDRKYGARKKYYASNYGSRKGYDDSVYSSDRYSKQHAASDRKEYDAAADKKSDSYDSSAYSSKYKADDYDKKTDSSYNDKESDSYYKNDQKSSYDKTASVQKESTPTYTAPSYSPPSYGGSNYRGQSYQRPQYGGYKSGGSGYRGSGYGNYRPSYRNSGHGGYDQRYPRSHFPEILRKNQKIFNENGTLEESVINEANNSTVEELGERSERSYGGYRDPSYSASAYDSKSSYDSDDRSSSDSDKYKSSYDSSDVRAYDKESDNYDSRKDAYSAAAYAKKHSDAAYYDKDVAYRDRKYGANKKFYASNYGSNKGYEDSVYSTDRYSTAHSGSDHKEYDAAADKKSDSYDSSSSSSRYKADDYDRKTDSSSRDSDRDYYSRSDSKNNYDSKSAVEKESRPTYTAPAYDTYDSGSSHGGSDYGGSHDGDYEGRYPRSEIGNSDNATSAITVDDSVLNREETEDEANETPETITNVELDD